MEASSSSCSHNFEHDVFLNFRGADVRDGLLSHLYVALKNKGINVYKDDEELERGKPIESSLFEAIQKSKIILVLFSPDYGSSSWCLDELVKINQCRKSNDQIVLPVFYKVDPSHIQEQTGVVAEAFQKHNLNFENGKIQDWRNALFNVATLSGWDKERSDADLVKHIVNEVLNRLDLDELDFEDKSLVGMDAHIKEMDKLLNLERDDVRIVGIWGSGGIGKTTIADSVCKRHSKKFYASYHLTCKQKEPNALQEEFIFRFLSKKYKNIRNVSSGLNIIHKRLCGKKVLLMLDDVDKPEQLTALANVQLFGQGSRIIVTTRDEHVFAPFEEKYIYKVPLMGKDQALQLFRVHAFRKNQPPNNFSELSEKFVSYAHGLPLVLKVLGAHLCGRLDMAFWRSELEKLQKTQSEEIYKVLKISFDGLKDLEKEVFLDVVFFFIGKNKVFVEEILYHCGFHPISAFTILKEKALITVEHGHLCIHEMLQAMGREVVREESTKDPNERSRISYPNDVHDVLTNGKGSKKIEGISVDMSKMKTIDLCPDALMRMPQLRILKFYKGWNSNSKGIQCSRGLFFLPEMLRYICWDQFPNKSLPSKFLGENLVTLKLRESEVKHLWTRDPELMHLVNIDLSYSKSLKILPDLSKAIKIENINLRGCTKFEKLPKRLPPNLMELDLSSTAIKELSSDIQSLKRLKSLALIDCKKLSTLPIEVGALESLESVDLDKSGIRELPESFVNLHMLQWLFLGGCTKLVRLPSCMHELSSLGYIDISGCKSLCSLPELPPSLLGLNSGECCSLETLSMNGLTSDIEELDLGNSFKLNTKACSEVPEYCKMVLHSKTQNLIKNDFVKCIMPGEEIPDWFEYKSGGSSICIKLPPSLLSFDQIERIAFCVVVGPRYDDDGDEYDACALVGCNHHSRKLFLDFYPSVDHVIVWAPYRLDQFEYSTTVGVFQSDFTSDEVVIKKYGIHLITDRVEAVPYSSSFSHDDPTQGTRKRKAEEADTTDESSKSKRTRFSWIFSRLLPFKQIKQIKHIMNQIKSKQINK